MPHVVSLDATKVTKLSPLVIHLFLKLNYIATFHVWPKRQPAFSSVLWILLTIEAMTMHQPRGELAVVRSGLFWTPGATSFFSFLKSTVLSASWRRRKPLTEELSHRLLPNYNLWLTRGFTHLDRACSLLPFGQRKATKRLEISYRTLF